MVRALKYVLFAAIIVAAVVFVIYSYVVSPTKAPTTTMNETPSVEASDQTADDTTDETFRIVSEKTTASFSLNEMLRGEPVTVVGTTNQVTGGVTADRADLGTMSLGTVRINARTFVTDNEQRNNAIRRLVLKTEDDANEFIEFTATSVTGLPQTAEIGTPFAFQTTGNLTVSGVTREVTFSGTATFTSDNEITGSAETFLHYPDFGISVPDLPFLADVAQDTSLKIEFVAQRS
jgi:polyisoprenoid-binding protein YceI